jgi:hypothetical protein
MTNNHGCDILTAAHGCRGTTASNVFQPRVGFVEAHQTVGETSVAHIHTLSDIPSSQYLGASSFSLWRKRLGGPRCLFAWQPFIQQHGTLSSSSTGDCARKKAAELLQHRTTAVSKQPQKHRAPRTAQRKRRLERPWDDAAAANPSCRPEREFIVMAS